MNLNPEFQRLLWLHVTPGRLLAMPSLIGLIVALTWFSADPNERGMMLYSLGIAGFILLPLFWGARQSGESLRQELEENTWEAQRMSVLGPWQLTWGKLLGSTLLSWYGGLQLLGVLGAGWVLGARAELTAYPLFKVVLLLLLAALFMQGLSLLMRIYMARGFGARRRGSDAIYLLVFIYFIGIIVSALGDRISYIEWYDYRLVQLDFIIASLLFWGPWVLFGCYRQMRRELMFRNGPFAWPLFLIALATYVAGFLHEQALANHLILSLALLLALGYLLALTDARSPLTLRHLHIAWHRGHSLAFSDQLPLWVMPLLLALLAALAFIPVGQQFAAGVWGLSLLLFALRDIGLMHYYSFSPSMRRPELAIGFSLIAAYLLFPLLLGQLVGKGHPLLTLFWPHPDQPAIWLLLAPGLQLLLVVILLRARLHAMHLFTDYSTR